jgi:hypothetical protein
MATRDTIAVMLDRWPRVPVYHAPITREVWSEQHGRTMYEWFTVCGREVPDSAPFMRLFHLARFARPCRRCYHDAQPEGCRTQGAEHGGA